MTGEQYSSLQINRAYSPVIGSVFLRIAGISFPKDPYNRMFCGRVPNIIFLIQEVNNGT